MLSGHGIKGTGSDGVLGVGLGGRLEQHDDLVPIRKDDPQEEGERHDEHAKGRRNFRGGLNLAGEDEHDGEEYDVAEHEEPVAGLWASESSIYGRFGYGPATYSMKTEIDARSTTFRGQDDKGAVRLLEPAEAEASIKTVYEEARSRRAGMISRSEAWWKYRVMADSASRRGSRSSLRYAVFQEDGETTGYATYRQKEHWEDFVSNGEVEVTEIITTTDEALSGLWSFLSNIDLFPDVEWWNTPVDDPLIHMVTDPRRVRRSVKDALWIRIMDVPAALTSRGYESDGVVTFEVADSTRPGTAGTYRLDCSEGAGACQRVGDGAEISMDIDVLGHLYLGGGSALGMAASGRIEGDPAAIRTLHRLFRADRAPWCPEIF